MSNTKELKKALVQLITSTMGNRTGQLFNQFYHETSRPQHLLSVAENLLTDFLGSKKAKDELDPIYQKFL